MGTNNIPPLPSAKQLAPNFIGNTIYYNYPYLTEGFVTAISDEHGYIRGHPNNNGSTYKEWNNDIDKIKFDYLYKNMIKETLIGDGTTGSGGLMIPTTNTNNTNNNNNCII